jgi:hypothetical protein
VDKRILVILSLCIRAKEKGNDCFFTYSPHINEVSVDIHKGGWVKPLENGDGDYIIGSDNKTESFSFNLSDTDKIIQVEDYLKGLI